MFLLEFGESSAHASKVPNPFYPSLKQWMQMDTALEHQMPKYVTPSGTAKSKQNLDSKFYMLPNLPKSP